MSEPLRGIVVAHGDLAASFVATVDRITGRGDVLLAVSNDGLGADQLRDHVAEACDPGPAIVFVDLAGGSCAMAGLCLRRTRADVGVLTGLNLPMLLDFVFHRDMPVDELIGRLEEMARAGIGGHLCGCAESDAEPSKGS
ncbi:MAG: PTS sugar transporter subunit IIA [Gemmatimonadota bacterium]